MPKLKKQCRSDFTVVNNVMVKDTALGFAERGLLLTMLSLPEDWNFSIKGLATLSPDGEHKIATLLKKIEKKGYLKRERIHSKDGRFADWVYTFSDEPIFAEENDEKMSNVSSKFDVSNVENLENSPHSENRHVVGLSKNLSPDGGFPDVDNPDVENRNTNKINNNKINNNILSINQVSSNNKNKIHIGQKDDVIDEMDFQGKVDEINERLEVDHLCFNGDISKKEIKEIVELIAWVMITPQENIQISGVPTSVNLVRKRFEMLDSSHIEYVFECLHGTETKIKNRPNYLLTCLFKAPITMEGYYDNAVRHDMKRSP